MSPAGPDCKAVLWQNVLALMRLRYGGENLTQFAKDVKVGPGTATRIKEQRTSVGLDVLQKIADTFGLAPWQLLVPSLDPQNAPVLAPLTDAERKLYAKLRETVEQVQGLLREQGNTRPTPLD